MSKIWKTNFNLSSKKIFFVATVESTLIYGCESWAMTDTMEKSLNGTYSTHACLRGSCLYTTNEELYGELPAVTDNYLPRESSKQGAAIAILS